MGREIRTAESSNRLMAEAYWSDYIIHILFLLLNILEISPLVYGLYATSTVVINGKV